ncbi:MAG: hypothetical protein EBZ47_04700 [Chlamydiae bacterium]|nr:hypothetical protein [Chlamydiota bacterium]
MKFTGELFELSWLFWQVWWWDLRESNKVRKQFYTNALVASIDKSIRKKYRYRSPFLISKLFLQQKGNVEVHRYGETPLTSLDEIAKRVQLEDTDCWMELGSGRSRGVFFLAARYKCRGVGVEWIPEFVLKSLSILKLFPNMNVSIYLSDFLKMDYTKATVIYVYGLCLEEIVLEQLAKKLSTLSSKVKIITISFPLTEYLPDHFYVVDQFSTSFNWGTADVFVQIPL